MGCPPGPVGVGRAGGRDHGGGTAGEMSICGGRELRLQGAIATGCRALGFYEQASVGKLLNVTKPPAYSAAAGVPGRVIRDKRRTVASVLYGSRA